MTPEPIQNLIIGSGEGGKFLAWHLAQSGQPTLVVERRWIGGSCPNTNCLPSKNEIWSAKVAHLLHHANHFGFNIPTPTFDLAAVRQRKRDMVDGLIKAHLDRYKATGAQLLMGSARLTAPRTVEVTLNTGGTRTFLPERLFLNLGTHATIPPIPGLAESKPLTHIEILELDRLPEHLIILGGGYVGLEFAQAYRRFGSRVTILHHAPQLLAHNDPDVIAEVSRILSAEGITVITSAEIQTVQGLSGSSVTVTVKTPTGTTTIQGTHLLVSTGRTPNTSNIGLDLAGIQLDPRGYLKVNERLETTAPNVYAIGECAGTPQFTHVSLDDYRIIRDNLAGGHRTTTVRLIPSCLFIDPPLAHIGLSETEAARRNIPYRLAKIPAAAVLRTRTLDETQGFLKALIDPATSRILGFTMIAPDAGEVMATVQTAMLANLPYTHLRDAILAHPTMAEGLNVLFSAPLK
ncbi:MAG TPA: FAD-dependent oxidoreductase [Tepidisphaeraceae bacterium]|jgi:pyruvate/2-oxoglutarate dehydrogenase complex dihydrolipoamide dehydrogenase (E3) component|nr:FAD-dependent oxidoreductase [Tepidisphaeraceae bacterium]